MHGKSTGAALLLIATLLSATGRADDKTDQARIHFNEGVSLFEEGDYERAAIAFARAYELKPSYKILYNIGQTENELKHYARALQAYQKYLAEGGDEVPADRAKELAKIVKRLEALVGRVLIDYPVPGVLIMIDGERRGETPLEEPVFLDMGNHELELRRGIEVVYRETLRIAGGQVLKVELNAPEAEPKPDQATQAQPTVEPRPQEAAPEEKPEPQPSAPNAQGEKSGRTWTWVALGLGAAAGITGGVIGGVAMSKESALEGDCPGGVCPMDKKAERDSIKTMYTTADVLYGAAAVGLTAAIILFFVEPRGETEPTGAVAIVPGATSHGATLNLSGRF